MILTFNYRFIFLFGLVLAVNELHAKDSSQWEDPWDFTVTNSPFIKSTFSKVLSQLCDVDGQIGRNKAELKVYERIAAFDRDQNGRITYAEFEKGIREVLDLRNAVVDISQEEGSEAIKDLIADSLIQKSIGPANVSQYTDTSPEDLACVLRYYLNAEIPEPAALQRTLMARYIYSFEKQNGIPEPDGQFEFETLKSLIAKDRILPDLAKDEQDPAR